MRNLEISTEEINFSEFPNFPNGFILQVDGSSLSGCVENKYVSVHCARFPSGEEESLGVFRVNEKSKHSGQSSLLGNLHFIFFITPLSNIST